MKKILTYSAALLLGATMWSCVNDELDSTSIFVDPPIERTPFENYLYREFSIPYNIDLKYKMEDIEIDQQYQVVPARVESSKVMAVLLKHLWLDVYSEASPEGVDFVRKYAVRIIHFVGSGQFTSSGTVLGTAEGGKKITLTDINYLDPNNAATLTPQSLLRHYGKFQVIHHEFGHILNQMKNYSQSFQRISGNYVGDQWVNVDQGSRDTGGTAYPTAHSEGFVSPYSMNTVDEDFVETYSLYITKSAAQWETFLSNAGAGRAIIDQKVAMVNDYMKNSWNMSLDEIRAIVLRRASDIGELEFVDLK